MINLKNKTGAWLAAAAASLCLGACANLGIPSGGPRDEEPPRFVRSNPMPGTLNFRGNRLELTFDELVTVKDAFSNVTVSPGGGTAPRVTSSGRKIIVDFQDTLRSNTTYTVDFGRSILDNNEGNPLGSFAITFSTGADIDSLQMSGIALDAYTLEPQQGIVVGVHRADAPDSALATLPFERLTKTDDRGRFTLRGLKPIPYRLYALADLNNDARRDNPAELVAFYPKPITPTFEIATTIDTIWNLKAARVDTIVDREYVRYLPNNLLLSVFDEGYKPQYLTKYERPDSTFLRLTFNAPARRLPVLDFLGMDRPAYRLESSATLDTLTYWLADPRFIRADTLRLSLTYDITGADRRTIERTDTIMLTKPKSKQTKRKRSRKQIEADSIAAEKEKLIGVTFRPAGSLEVYQLPSLEFSEPVQRIDSMRYRLLTRKDTTWVEMPRPSLVPDSASAYRKWTLQMPVTPGSQYKFEMDTLAVSGIYGRPNAPISPEFKAKERNEYASLTLRLSPDTIPGYVEVLNSSDSPVQRARVVNGVVTFPYLTPSDYYARFIADTDSSGTFTPGSVELNRQPEDVYYYPGLLSLRRHDRSESWNLYSTPVDMQKPMKLLKNKPDSAKKRKATEEETEEEADDTFDVNSNPFDPNSRRSNRRNGTTTLPR